MAVNNRGVFIDVCSSTFLISTFNREGWFNLVFAVRIVGCMARRRTAIPLFPFYVQSISHETNELYTYFSENDFSEAVPRLLQTSDVIKKSQTMTFQRGCKWLILDLRGRPTWLVSFVPHQNRRGRMGNMGTGLNIGLIQSLHDKSSTKIDVTNIRNPFFEFPLAFLKQTNKASKKNLGSYPFSTCSFGAKAGFPCDVIQAEGDQLKGWRAEEEAKDCVGELSIQYMMSDTGSCLPSYSNCISLFFHILSPGPS